MIHHGLMDSIPASIWDVASLTGGRASLFVLPIGHGRSLFGAGPKSIVDTNMLSPGQVAEGYNFDLTEVRCEPLTPTTAGDLSGIVFTLWINQASYLEFPTSEAASSLTLHPLGGLVVPEASWGYPIKKPLRISAPNVFLGALDAARSDDPRRLRVSLRGWLHRPIQ